MEKHPFIALPDYAVSHILLGSFPCLKNGSYGDWFYLGSGKSNFWRLMEAVLDKKMPSKAEKAAEMQAAGIWITDVAMEIERTKENHGCLDSNLRIKSYNAEMIETVLNEQSIQAILCTSSWVGDVFEKKILPKLNLKASAPKLIRLPSPSPMADMAIRGNEEYKKILEENPSFTPWDFRLMKYRAAMK